jgi:polar amino acid transport system substrate-binding protein
LKILHLNQILVPICLSALISCGGGQGKAPELTCEADLPGHVLTTMAGSCYDGKYSNIEGLTTMLMNSEADAIQAVRQGIAEVFVCDETVLTDETLKELGLKVAFKGKDEFACAIAFPKGDTDILPEFNEFLTMMKADGSLDAIVDYWLHGGPPVPYPEAAEIKNEKPIRFSVAVSTAPIGYIKDGEWTGLDPDLMKRFCAWAGRKVEINYLAVASAIMGLQTGQLDAMGGSIFATEERRAYVAFSDPYYICHPAFFVKDESAVSEGGFFTWMKKSFRSNFLVEKRWKLLTDGLLVTIEITLLAILLGTLLGVGYCFLAMSRRRWMRTAAGVYDYLMQGIPILVLLLIMFYVVFAGSGISAVWVAVVTFALNFAASAGNVFASSIASVQKGQWEAGNALGFTPVQTFRWIIFPQALKNGLAPYEGHCISLLKGTSIVGYIAVMDITRASDLLRSRTFEAVMPLLAVTVLYFVLAWLLRRLLDLALLKK